MKPSHLSYGFLLSFLAALGLERWWMPSHPLLWASVLVGLSVIAGLFGKKDRRLPVAAACLLGASVAVLLAAGSVHQSSDSDLESWAQDEAVTVHGWIADAPDIRPTVTKLSVRADTVTDATGTHAVRGKVLVNDIGSWPRPELGDEVTVRGVLSRPEIIDGFDYPHYLELSGIRSVMTRGKVTLVRRGGPSLMRMLTRLRLQVEDRIGLVLPEPHGSLLAGLLTGTRRGLPTDLSDDFRHAGLTHIVAVSGYNVTIVLTLIGGLLFWIPVRKRFLPLALAAGAFALFTGASPPVVRAAIMGVLGLAALSLERVVTTRLLILWTAFIMLLLHPLALWYDASFQLSFLAVIGLSELSPMLKKFFRWVPETLALRESIVATVAAQIATIPLSILLFHQFSLIAPVSNLFVAPLIPLAMLLGTIALLFSLLWLPLGLLIAYYAWLLLQLILMTATVCGNLPFASVTF